jgi:hypothetical protein
VQSRHLFENTPAWFGIAALLGATSAVATVPAFSGRLRTHGAAASPAPATVIDVAADGLLVRDRQHTTAYRLTKGRFVATTQGPSPELDEVASCVHECRGFALSADIGLETRPNHDISIYEGSESWTIRSHGDTWQRQQMVVPEPDLEASVVAVATETGIDIRTAGGRDHSISHSEAFGLRTAHSGVAAVIDFPTAVPPMPVRAPVASLVVKPGTDGGYAVFPLVPGRTVCVAKDGGSVVLRHLNGHTYLHNLADPKAAIRLPTAPISDYPQLHSGCTIGAAQLATVERLTTDAFVQLVNGRLPDANWRVSWLSPTGDVLGRHNVSAQVVALSPEGSKAALLRRDGVVVMDVNGGMREVLHSSAVVDVVFLPNGMLIAVDADGRPEVVPT